MSLVREAGTNVFTRGFSRGGSDIMNVLPIQVTYCFLYDWWALCFSIEYNYAKRLIKVGKKRPRSLSDLGQCTKRRESMDGFLIWGFESQRGHDFLEIFLAMSLSKERYCTIPIYIRSYLTYISALCSP